MLPGTGEVIPCDEHDGVVVVKPARDEHVPRLLGKFEGFEEDRFGPSVTDLGQSRSELVQHIAEQERVADVARECDCSAARFQSLLSSAFMARHLEYQERTRASRAGSSAPLATSTVSAIASRAPHVDLIQQF